MTVDATPPGWAEALLRVFLAPGDCDSVSGDLLEQYRDSVRPARGSRGADLWYVTQVLGFMWRHARLWAALFAIAFVARTALDWLVPPADFHARANVSTLLGAGIVLLAGFRTASRSGSFASGPVIGIATAALAAPIEVMGAVTLLAGWHDPLTMAAIRGRRSWRSLHVAAPDGPAWHRARHDWRLTRHRCHEIALGAAAPRSRAGLSSLTKTTPPSPDASCARPSAAASSARADRSSSATAPARPVWC
jgi:hypothetical protein